MSTFVESSNLDSLPYEELYRRLEEVVRQLDAGDLPLAEALASYERGMQLTAACQRQLDRAELRIQQVAGMTDGTPTLSEWEEQ